MTEMVVSILDLYFYEVPNDVFRTDHCLLEFSLCDSSQCGIEAAYTDEFHIDNYDLHITISEPHYPLELFVGVLQPNGTYLKLPIYLEICGYEQIDPTSTDVIQLFQSDLPDQAVNGDLIEILLEPLFTNDSPDNYCPITTYTLKTESGSTDAIDTYYYQWININETHLIIHEYAPLVTFAVMAETANGQKGWKSFDLQFDLCGTQEVNPIASPF
jgi:hypothetical protein